MSALKYQSGFGSVFSTEAIAGALPKGQNTPLRPPFDLYPEQISGTAFTMRRFENLRSWVYRLQPSVVQSPFTPYAQNYWTSQIANQGQTPPNPLRWMPMAKIANVDFIDGVRTMVANDATEGMAVHHYSFSAQVASRYFYNADGELILLPQKGALKIFTEMGTLEVRPQEIVVIPRGIKFKVDGVGADLDHSGYMGENTGAPLRLPDLGPIGANGLANPQDFYYPLAATEEKASCDVIICKFQNRFWSAKILNSPLNVVAWHGNYAPYKYNLKNFNTIGSISYDHPDPSIFTVLTSPSAIPGKANVDFVIFPPRWLVAEHTFRPPYYHRNLMNEYMGLIHGAYDAKQGGFVPGGASLHNCMVPHGPDYSTLKKERARGEAPHKIEDTMAFMFESSQVYQLSDFAVQQAAVDTNYWQCWQDLPRVDDPVVRR